MGLTHSSVGRGAEGSAHTKARGGEDLVIALAGNPNVGKSTVFNALTGMNQHTGNWPGKTVTSATGTFSEGGRNYLLVDIPGTYSLLANSQEEEVARDFLIFGHPDATVVVCDATCLLRNLNLVLQTMEISPRTVVCVNLLDEARRKKIRVDLGILERRLGVPVVGCTARKKKSLGDLVASLPKGKEEPQTAAFFIRYPEPVENAIRRVEAVLAPRVPDARRARWFSLKLLDADPALTEKIANEVGKDLVFSRETREAIALAWEDLKSSGIDENALRDLVVTALTRRAEEIVQGAVRCEKPDANERDRKIDRILTGRVTAYPVMLLLLAFLFWLTIFGANYPSAWLSRALFALEGLLSRLFAFWGAPAWLHGMLVSGVYRTLAWIVSVMLPPMAIFFPLFTLLEDAGYLPRIAYNLDRPFACCRACGKQALTMCMGFGCNAAGVVGCRIIDSQRERRLAILTNAFVPCNGRFPTLLTLISLFFLGTAAGILASFYSALALTALIVLGVLMTLLVTRFLSATLLRGSPSSFTLELPPYRRPQIGQVLVRSVFDRTLFVLGRAAVVAAPAGLLLWVLANVRAGDATLLAHCADFLDPVGRVLGMDGVLILAFLLSLPANEITLPIALMAYTAGGALSETSPEVMGEIFRQNGWTPVTAVSVVIFCLFHSPCTTTLITVYKETKSRLDTLLAALLPTVVGCLLCLAVNGIAHLFS